MICFKEKEFLLTANEYILFSCLLIFDCFSSFEKSAGMGNPNIFTDLVLHISVYGQPRKRA